MPKIVIQNLHQKEVYFTNNAKSVLRILHLNNIDWLHSCGGKGKCTTCKMIVRKGMEQLNPQTASEEAYMKEQLLFENERLACQAIPTGDLIILVPEETKLPHIKYS